MWYSVETSIVGSAAPRHKNVCTGIYCLIER